MNAIDSIAAEIVDSAYKIHKGLGPGWLESAYEACLEHEITQHEYLVERQEPQPVHYDGIVIDVGYRLDILHKNGIRRIANQFKDS